jgi:hypothetical protein
MPTRGFAKASLLVWLGHQGKAREAPKGSAFSSVNLRLHWRLDNVEELMGGWVKEVASMARRVVAPLHLKRLQCMAMVDEI